MNFFWITNDPVPSGEIISGCVFLGRMRFSYLVDVVFQISARSTKEFFNMMFFNPVYSYG